MSYVPPPATVVYFPANDVCSISHESFSVLHRQNRLVQASCNHFFDSESINRWTRQNPRCPMCNQQNITIRHVRIEEARDESLLGKLGRLIMTILEILWKGIVFLCGVSILSNSSYTSHRTVIVETRRAPNLRTPSRDRMYVPPPATRTPAYVPPPADESVRNGRVVLGARAGY